MEQELLDKVRSKEAKPIAIALEKRVSQLREEKVKISDATLIAVAEALDFMAKGLRR